MKTIDGGNSWELVEFQTLNPLTSVCFTDAVNGWAVGGGGTIITTYKEETTSIKVKNNENAFTVNRFILNQNFPNPFNSSTKISYSISLPNFVIVTIYDMLGKEIYTLVNEYQKEGEYSIVFNAQELTSGIYLYKLQTNLGFIETKKMLLLR